MVHKSFDFSFNAIGLKMRALNPKKDPHRVSRRSINHYRSKRARLKESVGTVQTKKVLRCSLLNVDGLGESSLANIEEVVGSEKPDVVIILETKRIVEEQGIDISVPGYSVHEARRSNNAGDRDGGGIAMYTKLSDGILFKQYKPDIPDQTRAFVNSERMWITVQSQNSKTAICGLYLGCQYSDDGHSLWNDALYETV